VFYAQVTHRYARRCDCTARDMTARVSSATSVRSLSSRPPPRLRTSSLHSLPPIHLALCTPSTQQPKLFFTYQRPKQSCGSSIGKPTHPLSALRNMDTDLATGVSYTTSLLSAFPLRYRLTGIDLDIHVFLRYYESLAEMRRTPHERANDAGLTHDNKHMPHTVETHRGLEGGICLDMIKDMC
jgi:hypothetical protein